MTVIITAVGFHQDTDPNDVTETWTPALPPMTSQESKDEEKCPSLEEYVKVRYSTYAIHRHYYSDFQLYINVPRAVFRILNSFENHVITVQFRTKDFAFKTYDRAMSELNCWP